MHERLEKNLSNSVSLDLRFSLIQQHHGK